MAAISLLEATKLMPVGPQRAIVQIFAESSHFLSVCPFIEAPRGYVDWSTEQTLGTVASRVIGADYTAANGMYSPYKATCAIVGGKVQVDRAIRKAQPEAVSEMKANKIRSMAYQITKQAFEGQGVADIKGISKWVSADYTGQFIDASNAVITMALMDSMVDLNNHIMGSTYIYMTQTPFNALNTLSRTNGTGQQNIQYGVDQFGSRVPFYGTIPIIIMKKGDGTDILSVVESTGIGGSHAGGALTSIYTVTYGPEMFHGIQLGSMDIINNTDATNFEEFLIEWIASVAPKTKRSIVRMHDVKNSLT